MQNYTIDDERSCYHWPFFNVKNKRVLDIGCGRWGLDELDQNSPIYFSNNGASLVVGIDGNIDEINYFKQQVGDNSKYNFIHLHIHNATPIIDIIKNYNIEAIKCDIEGDEILLTDMTREDLKNVTEFALEYHSNELRDIYLSKMIEWGFAVNRDIKFGTTNYMGVLFCSK
jgi:SAM-dependent methyltransferase